jgi:hypothetical protein
VTAAFAVFVRTGRAPAFPRNESDASTPPSPPDPAHHNIVCSHETIARAVVAALTFDEDFTLVANLSDPNPAYDTYRLQELISRCES